MNFHLKPLRSTRNPKRKHDCIAEGSGQTGSTFSEYCNFLGARKPVWFYSEMVPWLFRGFDHVFPHKNPAAKFHSGTQNISCQLPLTEMMIQFIFLPTVTNIFQTLVVASNLLVTPTIQAPGTGLASSDSSGCTPPGIYRLIVI